MVNVHFQSMPLSYFIVKQIVWHGSLLMLTFTQKPHFFSASDTWN